MSRLLAIVSLLSLSCISRQPSPHEGLVTTINLSLVAPNPGSPGAPNTVQDATFSLLALDDTGNLYGGDALVDIYVSSGGVRSGVEQECGTKSDAPIETLTVHGGRLDNHSITLPTAYGITAIWAEERGSHAVGASIPIYFANPTIPNIQTPANPSAPNATFCTPFEKRFVQVDAATGSGELLVDSLFGNAITVTDTGATDYRSLYLFTFGRPDATLVPGRHVRSITGNISKFVGFTEVNFPVVIPDLDLPIEPQKLPAPIPLKQTDLINLSKMNAAGSSVVEITGKVCPANPANPNHDPNIQKTIDQWVKYNTFVLATTTNCDPFTEFSVALPSKVMGTFDPTQLINQTATIRGMLKNASGQNSAVDVDGNTITCSDSTPCALPNTTCVNSICKGKPYNIWTVTVRGTDDVPQ